jgi:hypothetical protein
VRLVRTEYWNPSTGTVRTGSTGHGESLADVETYLLPLTGALLGEAFGSGVAHGLEVSATAGQQGLTVNTGLAVDGTGQPIVLSDDGAAVVDPNAPTGVQNVPLVLVGSGGVELPTSGLTGAQVLTITAREALDGTAGAAAWSLVHAPWLQLVPQATFTDDGTRVPLALVTLDATGAVTGLDAGPRRQVSPAVGGLTFRRTTVTGGQTLSVGAAVGPSLQTRQDGGLDVVLPGPQTGAALSVEGATGRVGIAAGNAPLAAALQVGGGVHSGGADAGFSFMDRHVAGYVDAPTAGQRWVWYADVGYARLWSGTDQLSVGAPGDGGGLDVPRRMRVRQGADASAGIWFWQNAAPQAAFVGMSDDTHVGLWGHAVGWGLTMDVGVGDLATHSGLTVGADTRANLSVTGDVTVGAGNNGSVTTRHVNGKQVGNDGPDDLYLNWDTGKGVHVGGAAPATLSVHGPAVVDANLRAGGGLTMPGGGTIQSEGRLHVTGPELLYLLNHDGVIVGKEWGGTGNLTVEGTLRTSTSVNLPAQSTIAGDGRLHITGGEILYLLNHDGVIVGKEWGGTGNLTVEGPHLVTNGAAPLPAWSGGGVSTWDVFAAGGVYVGDPDNASCWMKPDGSKHFVINHPLDPDNRSLDHVCIEGPEAAVYYRGSGRLAGGRAEVELPEYFEALTRVEDRTVLLTAVCDDDEPVAVLAASPLRDGRFTVRAADGTNPRQRFHWEVKAVRADVERLVVEPEKRARELARVG